MPAGRSGGSSPWRRRYSRSRLLPGGVGAGSVTATTSDAGNVSSNPCHSQIEPIPRRHHDNTAGETGLYLLLPVCGVWACGRSSFKGRYGTMLLPPAFFEVSTMILSVPPNSRSMVSRYMRWHGLGDLRHAPARFRHDAVGVGLRLVLGALGVDTRRLHVAECVDDLRRRIDFLQLDLRDLNAGPTIEGGVQDL